MKEFNRASIDVIRNDIQKLLDEYGQKNGIKVMLDNHTTMTLTRTQFHTKLIAICGETADNAEYPMDAKYASALDDPYTCKDYGVNKSVLGTQAKVNGKEMAFVGISPKKRKFPYTLRELSTGTYYGLSKESAAVRLLQIKAGIKAA